MQAAAISPFEIKKGIERSRSDRTDLRAIKVRPTIGVLSTHAIPNELTP